MVRLSIVSSLYGSAPYVTEFYERVSREAKKLTSEYEIILINDGSPDDSLEKALALQQNDPRVIVIDLSRNFGHHRAMMTGLSYAQGDHVFLLDADLEEEPEWLSTFESIRTRESCDVVYGVQAARKGAWIERLSGALFYRVFNLLSNTPIPANAVTARLMSKRYVHSLLAHREREVYIFGLWPLTGYRQVPCVVTKHSKGTSTYSLAKRIALFVNAITSFSDKPLVYIFYFGMFITFSAVVLSTRLVIHKLRDGIPVMGWASVIVSIWLLGGLIISFLGIIGIYLAKVYREIKNRPYAIVRRVYAAEQKSSVG